MASKLVEREARSIPLTAREIMNPFVYTVQADTQTTLIGGLAAAAAFLIARAISQ